jgi:hypothetical protein
MSNINQGYILADWSLVSKYFCTTVHESNSGIDVRQTFVKWDLCSYGPSYTSTKKEHGYTIVYQMLI